MEPRHLLNIVLYDHLPSTLYIKDFVSVNSRYIPLTFGAMHREGFKVGVLLYDWCIASLTSLTPNGSSHSLFNNILVTYVSIIMSPYGLALSTVSI